MACWQCGHVRQCYQIVHQSQASPVAFPECNGCSRYHGRSVSGTTGTDARMRESRRVPPALAQHHVLAPSYSTCANFDDVLTSYLVYDTAQVAERRRTLRYIERPSTYVKVHRQTSYHPSTHRRAGYHPSTCRRASCHPSTCQRTSCHPFTCRRTSCHPFTCRRASIQAKFNLR